ncbi:acyl carrier protein [Novosphingobium sp. BL-52-GroH]|uniref:acyl carrier protein n=1 Tax=Novosphingobium sp. BL-52-GroH TaxID=3349877 RepID=UPI00384F1232
MNHDDVMALIAKETGLPLEQLRPEATLATLDISSLDLVSLLFELEDRYGVEIEPEELSRETTLGQLLERIGVAAPR